jgi:hypothetical protein
MHGFLPRRTVAHKEFASARANGMEDQPDADHGILGISAERFGKYR